MGYCSKEWLKHDFELPEDLALDKLLTEEIYGLYLMGIISEGKFREVTGIDFDDFNKMNVEIRKVHEAIEFLIKENEKVQQQRDKLSKQLFRISETVRCRICGELQTQCRCFVKPNDHVF